MGHRQLALIFALITSLVAIVITLGAMLLEQPPGLAVIVSITLFVASSFVQVGIAKKKWELDYKNTFIMLLSTSVPCALIYTIVFQQIVNLFPAYRTEDFHFLPFFFGCILFRLPGDAIAAIFHKRSIPNNP